MLSPEELMEALLNTAKGSPGGPVSLLFQSRKGHQAEGSNDIVQSTNPSPRNPVTSLITNHSSRSA